MISRAILGLGFLMAAWAAAASAQAYLPGSNQWTGENVYRGVELILAYDDGNASKFTPEQDTLFEMTSSWMTGAAQAFASVQMLNGSASAALCRARLQKMTLVDLARNYANYWTAHPAVHNQPALGILANSLFVGPQCR